MRLTPPTNSTFYASGTLGVVALVLGLSSGFTLTATLALAGLVLLVVGNVYEKI